jgi:murein DD-endopeptidase MepM/ murein hydrolase activator NlpD
MQPQPFKLYVPLAKVIVKEGWFHKVEKQVDSLDTFRQAINMNNLFGANERWYKKNLGIDGGHNGLDIACATGTDVLNPLLEGGWIIEEHDDEKDRKAGFGVVIVSNVPYIFNDDSISHAKIVLWHHKYNVVRVRESVVFRQLVAKSDSTGVSTAPHLHLGLKQCDSNANTINWDNGHKGAINPLDYLAFYVSNPT